MKTKQKTLDDYPLLKSILAPAMAYAMLIKVTNVLVAEFNYALNGCMVEYGE